jgi:hypothetical protein
MTKPKIFETPNPEEQPVLKPITWGSMKQISRLQMQMAYWQNSDDPDRGEKVMAVMEQIQAMVAKQIISLPLDWFAEPPAEQPDYSDPSVLDGLISDKFQRLIEMLAGTQQATEAKN